MAKIEQSSAEKLARLQLGFIEQRNTATAALDAATAIARSAEPLPFDEGIALAQLTAAMAADATQGSKTANEVQVNIAKSRADAEIAIESHRVGKNQARLDCDRLTAEIKGLDAQVRQIDGLLRAELSELALSDVKLMREAIVKDGEELLLKMITLQSVTDVTGIEEINPQGHQLDWVSLLECTIGLPFKSDKYEYLMQRGYKDIELAQSVRLDYINNLTGGVWPTSMKPLHEQVYFAK